MSIRSSACSGPDHEIQVRKIMFRAHGAEAEERMACHRTSLVAAIPLSSRTVDRAGNP